MNTLKVLTGAVAVAGALSGSQVAAGDLALPPLEQPAEVQVGDWYISLFGGAVSTPEVVLEDYYYNYEDYITDEFVTQNLDLGFALGLAVGTEVFDDVRGELELSATRSELGDLEYSYYSYDPYDPDSSIEAEGSLDRDGDVTTTYLLGNLWYELDLDSPVKPYVGAGIGVGSATLTDREGDTESYTATGFAYQLGTGFTLDVSDSITLDLGYRFKNLVNLQFKNSDGRSYDIEQENFTQHVFQGGVRFEF